MYWFLTICGALATRDSVPQRKQFFCICEAGLIKLEHIQANKCHPLATAKSYSLHGRVLGSPQSQKQKFKSSFNKLLLFFFFWGGGGYDSPRKQELLLLWHEFKIFKSQ